MNDAARHLHERSNSLESAALLALLNAVAMMALALAAAFLDVPAWAGRFVAAGCGFFLFMFWLARRSSKLRTAATRSETLRREHQLRICAKS